MEVLITTTLIFPKEIFSAITRKTSGNFFQQTLGTKAILLNKYKNVDTSEHLQNYIQKRKIVSNIRS